MPRLFISYRRADSTDAAGRIYDRLAAAFGAENVFKDVDSIPFGSDFTRVITEQMAKCDVAIVVIGRSWMNVRNPKGGRRLDDPSDFVRIEVVQALGSRILVVPVLVGNASMPSEDELPVSLRPLTRRHALMARPDPDFHRDMDRLVKSLQDHFGIAPSPVPPKPAPAPKSAAAPKPAATEPKPSKTAAPPATTVKKPAPREGDAAPVLNAEPKTAEPSSRGVGNRSLRSVAALGMLIGFTVVVGYGSIKLFSKQPKPEEKNPPATVAPQTPTPKGPPSKDDGLSPGEKWDDFEYMIDGVKKTGRCRVLTLDIGGGEKMEFVRIQKGSFKMGSPSSEDSHQEDEELHEVEITKDFYLGRYLVTQAQYKVIAGENPSSFKGDRLPVERVSWDDADRYCKSLSTRLGRKAALPSEAQWEYACRAGTRTPFYFGSKLNGDLANCDGNCPYGTTVKGPDKVTTTEVGSYPANPWGLYDMSGNVFQWCQDWYGPYSKLDGIRDPVQLSKQPDNYKLLRGGSLYSSAWFCRSASRRTSAPDARYTTFGFRVLLALER